jgi:hypothetical protein
MNHQLTLCDKIRKIHGSALTVKKFSTQNFLLIHRKRGKDCDEKKLFIIHRQSEDFQSSND